MGRDSCSRSAPHPAKASHASVFSRGTRRARLSILVLAIAVTSSRPLRNPASSSANGPQSPRPRHMYPGIRSRSSKSPAGDSANKLSKSSMRAVKRSSESGASMSNIGRKTPPHTLVSDRMASSTSVADRTFTRAPTRHGRIETRPLNSALYGRANFAQFCRDKAIRPARLFVRCPRADAKDNSRRRSQPVPTFCPHPYEKPCDVG